MDWSSKVVFITGAASGIGQSLAYELAENGADIALMDVDADGLNETKKRLASNESNHLVLKGDVTDPDDIERCFRSTANELGTPDLVFANAGVGYTTPAGELNLDDFKRLLAVNYEGVVNTVQQALDRMMSSGNPGHLVITSSVAAFTSMKGGAAYCGSKAAVLRLAESLRFDLRDDPISVTTIHPGWVRTPMTEKYPEKMRFYEISAEDAAQRIRKGVEADKNRIIFPWPMKFLVNLISITPNTVVDFIRERLPVPEEV